MARNEVFRVYQDEETMLKVYDRRLRIADRKYEKGEPERRAYVARYRNEVDPDQVNEDGHRVVVTTGISIIDTMFASMVAVDIEFIAKSIGRGTVEQALAATAALNQAWYDTKGGKRARRAIKDALLTDLGWVKVYYDYVEDVELRDVPEEALEAQVAQLQGERGKPFTEAELEAMVADETLQLTEEVPIVLRDRVCVDYVPWNLVRYDPSAKQIEDVRWVAQYTKLPEYEVKKNPQWVEFVKARYGERKGPKMLDELAGDSRISTGLEVDAELLRDFGEDDEHDDARVTVVEMWDLETGLVTVFPKGNQELVLHQRINPLMFNLDLEDRNPFKPLTVRDDPDNFEGLGDMRIIFPGLEELDEYRSNAATYVARTIPKVFGPERALTETGKDALKSPVWGEYVGLEEGFTRQDIGDVAIPPLPQEAYNIPDQVQFELKEATGASEPMRGVFPTRRTTATETQIVTGKGEERQAERRGALEDWYLGVAKTMLQLMQVFYDQERILRYVDDLGQEFEWKWTREDIAIDADIRVALTPRENLTRDQRVQRSLQLMNLALPLPETDRGELMRLVAREMGFRDSEIRAVIRSDAEVQAQQQQEQVAAQLATAPQQYGNAPPGLSITPGGG
jgi:hypothetical protein